jgi:uncharacterized protein YbjT (DUF2867 family)
MREPNPILVTGVPGRVGAVGSAVVALLRARDIPVRALVLHQDERTEALRSSGVDVVVGDLSRTEDVTRALQGCRRMYFGMSVSPVFLEATVSVAAVAREQGDLERLVAISQMTVSQMSSRRMTESRQQRQHWFAEQALRWSGLPVVVVRPTVFLEHPFFLDWAAETIAADGTLRLPFGGARTSPIAAHDVADAIATLLASPEPPARDLYELTGPRSEDMRAMAAEYSSALGRTVTYVDVPMDRWLAELRARNLPEHIRDHFVTMARLHAENAYDRATADYESIAGKPGTTVRDFVASHADLFRPRAQRTASPTLSA